MRGSAPVSVTEIHLALATAHSGIKPRPVKSGSVEMVAPPVCVLAENHEGRAVWLNVESWELIPHRGPIIDELTQQPLPERAGMLKFLVTIPDGYRLVKEGEPAVDIDLPGVHEPLAPVSHTGIPELDGIDPAVFQTDTVRHMEIMRELNNRKAAPPLGDNDKG